MREVSTLNSAKVKKRYILKLYNSIMALKNKLKEKELRARNFTYKISRKIKKYLNKLIMKFNNISANNNKNLSIQLK